MSDVKEIKISNTVYDIVGKGVENQRDTSKAKIWIGNNTQYGDLQSLDNDTVYYRTDNGGTVQTAVNATNATSASSASSATNATNDGIGNNIVTTYATKSENSDKANKDMNNIADAGKSLISGLGMPSGNYEALTLGASGSEYTAPANGYFAARVTGSTSHYAFITNLSNGVGTSYQYNGSSGSWHAVFAPVKKGDKIVFVYGGADIQVFRFVYAEGEENV